MKADAKIAGSKTVQDWNDLKLKLIAHPNVRANWEEAFNDFLHKRICTRYLDPINAISNISAQEGKGFSIVAIYCSLIEFFETLKKGYAYDQRNYTDRHNQIIRSVTVFDPNGVAQPLSNKELFINFLTENLPFSTVFSRPTAESFYFYVRCAILHQAETGPNWFIKDGDLKDPILEISAGTPAEITLHWKPLKIAFDEYLENTYKNLLFNNALTQEHFIFKWDNICQ